MKNLLLPASILILALTQVSGMLESTAVNKCVTGMTRAYTRKDATEEGRRRAQASAVNYCNGR